MIFTEFRFLFFFLAVFLVHWALRGLTARKLWLFAAGLVFYGAWDWRFLGLLMFSVALDWIVAAADPGREHARPEAPLAARQRGGATSACSRFFKYLNFFVDSAVDLLAPARVRGAPSDARRSSCRSGSASTPSRRCRYTIDVYRGKLGRRRERSWTSRLFVTFFPQLVAGPIIRAAHFLPLARARIATSRGTSQVRACLTLFLVGFVKKACISDNVAPIVDPYFVDPEAYGALERLGRGADVRGADLLRLLGLLGHGARPAPGCSATSSSSTSTSPTWRADIREFWRRWHISLSTLAARLPLHPARRQPRQPARPPTAT